MTLAEFIALVKDEANKGTSLDSYIPTRVQMAINNAERGYTLKYMEIEEEQTLAADAQTVTLDETVKSVNWVRYTRDTGEYIYLRQVIDATMISENEEGYNPSGYYVNGSGVLVFDNAPDEALDLTISYNAYTSYPPADTHWLLQHAVDWLLAETMILLSFRAKEPKWREDYKPMQDRAEISIFRADVEARNANTSDAMLPPGETTHSARYPGDDGV